LNGKTGGRGHGVGKNASLAKAAKIDRLAFQFRLDAGFLTKTRKVCDLNARSAQLEGFGEFAGMTVTASKPEGQSKGTDFV